MATPYQRAVKSVPPNARHVGMADRMTFALVAILHFISKVSGHIFIG